MILFFSNIKKTFKKNLPQCTAKYLQIKKNTVCCNKNKTYSSLF